MLLNTLLNILSAGADIRNDFGEVLDIIAVLLRILCIITPVILVIWCSIDFAKAVVSHDADALKKAYNISIKRLIAGVIIFLLPFVVEFVMGIVGGDDYKDAEVEGTYEGLYNIVEENSRYS